MAPQLTIRWAAVGAAIGVALAIALGAETAAAQTFTIDFGPTDAGAAGGGSGADAAAGGDNLLSARVVQLFVLITVLSLAPGIAVMVTCFPFMATTLSILRQAIGLQSAPPNMLIISLALFLTYFVMEPVFTEAWAVGVQPMLDGRLTPEEAFGPTMDPFRRFMEARVDDSALRELMAAVPDRAPAPGEETPLSILAPAFMLSEIERAFEIGFMIFLPFLVIDLVVASTLMAMGMMMVPPAVVALPFKLAFFVMADGWSLLAGALVTGYAT